VGDFSFGFGLEFKFPFDFAAARQILEWREAGCCDGGHVEVNW